MPVPVPPRFKLANVELNAELVSEPLKNDAAAAEAASSFSRSPVLPLASLLGVSLDALRSSASRSSACTSSLTPVVAAAGGGGGDAAAATSEEEKKPPRRGRGLGLATDKPVPLPLLVRRCVAARGSSALLLVPLLDEGATLVPLLVVVAAAAAAEDDDEEMDVRARGGAGWL